MPGPITYSNFSSLSSLSSNPRTQSSHIAKAYRQAAQLFLTRRLPEAFFTIEPVITPRNYSSAGQYNRNQNQYGIGDDSRSNGLQASEEPGGAENNSSELEYEPAPVAHASRGTRVKVWSFYLTFLNAVVELGPEEGKLAFGSARWKELVSKARDGSIWEDIVRDGYWGDEGAVDGEVVVNLATLLLTHSPSQTLNQQRLETFLATSPLFFQSTDSLDVLDDKNNNEAKYIDQNTSSQSGPSPSSISEVGTSYSNNNNKSPTRHNLDLALKILELYSLHILPRNDEWDYAREFLQMNSMLDEERSQAFLIALHVLREEERLAAVRSNEQRQTIGKRRRARTGGKKEMEMGRRRSDATVTATGSSISGDDAAAYLAGKEHAMAVPTAASQEANFARSSTGSGLNSSAKLITEERGHPRQREQRHQNGNTVSQESQSFNTPTPANVPDSKAIKTPHQQPQPQSIPTPAPAASRKSHAKQVNPPHSHEKSKKPIDQNAEYAKITKTKNTNTNIFTKILSSTLFASQGGRNTRGPSILSSFFSVQNKRHPALIKSILYILAMLTGVGLIGSAAAAAAAATGTTAPARTRGSGGGGGGVGGNRKPAAVRVRPGLGLGFGVVEKVLRMLRNLVVLVWMSVKRTVGMGVTISYI